MCVMPSETGTNNLCLCGLVVDDLDLAVCGEFGHGHRMLGTDKETPKRRGKVRGSSANGQPGASSRVGRFLKAKKELAAGYRQVVNAESDLDSKR